MCFCGHCMVSPGGGVSLSAPLTTGVRALPCAGAPAQGGAPLQGSAGGPLSVWASVGGQPYRPLPQGSVSHTGLPTRSCALGAPGVPRPPGWPSVSLPIVSSHWTAKVARTWMPTGHFVPIHSPRRLRGQGDPHSDKQLFRTGTGGLPGSWPLSTAQSLRPRTQDSPARAVPASLPGRPPGEGGCGA